MKNLTLTIIFTIGLFSIGFAQKATPTEPTTTKVNLTSEATSKLEFVKKSHDFAKIDEGVQATYEFKFINTGDAPLILKNVKASCGCTTPKWNREPIAPGAEGSIIAIYNSKGRPGNFTKTITVTHNGSGGTDYLTIRGEVLKKAVAPTSPVIATPSN